MPSRSSSAAWSGRPPAIERERRLDFAHRGELFGSQLRRNEAQDADSPGPSAEQFRRVVQEPSHLLLAKQRQGKERKRTVLRNRLGKPGDVADASHRSLQDRVTRAVVNGQGRTLGKRSYDFRATEAFRNAALDGLNDPAGRHILSREPLGEGGVLTGRWALPGPPPDAG